MSAIPLARILVDFGPEGDLGQGRGAGTSHRAGQASPRTTEDSAARIAEALARGRDEGKAAAEAEFQIRLDAQREEFDQRLASERQAWVEQEGKALAERILAAMRDMEARIGESTARVLRPLLAAQVRRQAVTELVSLVETMLSKDQNATLAVSGPEDLIGVLRERLAGTAANVTFSSSNAPDVQVTIDQTILQTRLEAWIACIEEAVA